MIAIQEKYRAVQRGKYKKLFEVVISSSLMAIATFILFNSSASTDRSKECRVLREKLMPSIRDFQKVTSFSCSHASTSENSMSVISYSLYGADPRYISGALINAALYREIFKGWKMRVYHDDTVPTDILDALLEANVELVDMSGIDMNPMNWRFLAASDPSIDRMCSRDIDSRLTFREYHAVTEWSQTTFKVHIIRDHPSHVEQRCAMPGGMWCVQGGILANMDDLIDAYNKDTHFNADQEFLQERVWPIIKDEALQHVSFSCETHTNVRKMLPRVGMEHVGAVYLDGELRETDVKLLRDAISNAEDC